MKFFNYIPLLFLAACASTENNEQAIASKMEEEPAGISLTQAQKAETNIITGRLEKQPFFISVPATGQVDVPPNQRAEIHSPLEVFVEDIKVLPGDEVKVGQVLAIVNHPKLISLQQEYRGLIIDKERIEKQLKRKKELLGSGVASQSEIDLLTSELASNQSAHEAISAQLTMLNIIPGQNIRKGTLRASIDGQVIHLGITKGALLMPQTIAFTLLDTDHKHLELNVFPTHAANLEKGQNVRFTVTSKNQKGNAKIHLINPVLSENHAINVHAHLMGDESDYIIGDFVNATIETGSDSSYQISSDELIFSGGKYSIFLMNDNDQYEAIEVTTGRTNDTHTELIGPGQLFQSEVVLKGNYYLNGI